MIRALVARRLWLIKNKLIPYLFVYMLLPFTIFAMIGSPLKNIIRSSIGEIPYDVWVFPGLIFILTSIIIFPPLFREFFILRIHGKSLTNLTLTPHKKVNIIFSSLVVSIFESVILAIITGIIYLYITKMSFNLPSILFLLICLITFLFLIGNLFISVFLIFDTISIALLSAGVIYLFLIFGNGSIIETSFFPQIVSTILEILPFSIPIKQFQIFKSIGVINFQSFLILIPLCYLWILFNASLLKRKMFQ